MLHLYDFLEEEGKEVRALYSKIVVRKIPKFLKELLKRLSGTLLKTTKSPPWKGKRNISSQTIRINN